MGEFGEFDGNGKELLFSVDNKGVDVNFEMGVERNEKGLENFEMGVEK